jgi:hypothetical protein
VTSGCQPELSDSKMYYSGSSYTASSASTPPTLRKYLSSRLDRFRA